MIPVDEPPLRRLGIGAPMSLLRTGAAAGAGVAPARGGGGAGGSGGGAARAGAAWTGLDRGGGMAAAGSGGGGAGAEGGAAAIGGGGVLRGSAGPQAGRPWLAGRPVESCAIGTRGVVSAVGLGSGRCGAGSVTVPESEP